MRWKLLNDRKICPECGAEMIPQEEYLDDTRRCHVQWWECPECGRCEERWN